MVFGFKVIVADQVCHTPCPPSLKLWRAKEVWHTGLFCGRKVGWIFGLAKKKIRHVPPAGHHGPLTGRDGFFLGVTIPIYTQG